MYSAEAALNVSRIAMNKNQQNLENRAKIALVAQEERKRKRRSITSSLIVAFYRKIPHVRNMAPLIASFLRIDFQISPTSSRRALDIVSRHRDLRLIKKHRSDLPDTWPLMDQLLVTEEFDWMSIELRAFLHILHSPSDPRLEMFGEIPHWSMLLERQMPPGLREHLERMTVKQLRDLSRKTLACRSSSVKKCDLVRDLLLYTQY
tara:strand:+ start:191 stop:805 length:615 start_codon:yes stop_codon:yes gene_type:complete